MNISEFIGQYKNHPILFVGTGISLRYLKNSFSWDDLLRETVIKLLGKDESYYDIKSKYHKDGICEYEKVAADIEKIFDETLSQDRNGSFKEINDIFYENMRNNKNISRFKIYLSKTFSEYALKEEMTEEINELKKIRKNISSIITTNYDGLLEDIFEFVPLIGNHILLSNPYGSIYKIHGCCKAPAEIIITDDDYKKFEEKYELIRAQLLSLFLHNPIIFIGYNLGDINIRKLLATIFSYVDVNSSQAEKIRNNFLVVEYEKDHNNLNVESYDIIIDGARPIKINKLKTDNFTALYSELSKLQLPISAMDIRKVQNIVKEIYAGGDIKVKITEDIDSLKNSDMVLAIGSDKTIQYQYLTHKTFLNDYFKIIDEANIQLIASIGKIKVQTSQFFPIFGFYKINNSMPNFRELKEIQEGKLNGLLNMILKKHVNSHTTPASIAEDDNIATSYKHYSIISSCIEKKITLNVLEKYLREQSIEQKSKTEYKRLLSVYDYLKYSDSTLTLRVNAGERL